LARSARWCRSAPAMHAQCVTAGLIDQHRLGFEGASTTFSPAVAAPGRRCHRSHRPGPTSSRERTKQLSSRLWGSRPGDWEAREITPASQRPSPGGNEVVAGGVVVIAGVGSVDDSGGRLPRTPMPCPRCACAGSKEVSLWGCTRGGACHRAPPPGRCSPRKRIVAVSGTPGPLVVAWRFSACWAMKDIEHMPRHDHQASLNRGAWG